MSKYPTLLQQFRSFCFQNNVTDLDQAIEYFAVFGGMGWAVNMSKSLDFLIEKKILKNYRYIHGDITRITKSNNIHHLLLSAISTGDRREHSAFKKANVGRNVGENSIDFLVDNGLLIVEKSIEKPVADEEVSEKLLFAQPFMRFWFSAVSPYYKGIKEGDYKEVKERWGHMQQGFSDHILQQLTMELVKNSFVEDPIKSIGSYWDKNIEIDILAKTKSGKMVAGLCKYSKAKAGKNELAKLKEDCKKAELDIDTYVIFSKNKFSNELKKEKSEDLKLFALRNIRSLLEGLNPKDLLVHTNKKY
ncbi:MAG TPA: ATPase [Campylobacterales bacterium]|nr:ATPase [Campylobacterales bacterium]